MADTKVASVCAHPMMMCVSLGGRGSEAGTGIDGSRRKRLHETERHLLCKCLFAVVTRW